MIELVQDQSGGVSRVDLGKAEWIEVTDDGLFHCFKHFGISEDDEQEQVEISRYQITKQPVTVFAHAVPANATGEYGLLIKYRTIDGREEERIIPRGFLSADSDPSRTVIPIEAEH